MKAQPFLWVGSVAGSCVITLLVTEWWHEAKATVEIAKIEVRSPGKPTDKLILGEDLAQKTHDHTYFKTLTEESTFEAVDKALDAARRETNIAVRTCKHVEALVNILTTQSMGLSLEKRRAQFLTLFVSKAEESDWFEDLAKATLDQYEAKLPPKYSAHPPGTEHLTVQLEHATYRLSEEDEEEDARRAQTQNKDVNAYAITLREAHRTNLWRRLYVYFEPEVLIDFLGTCKARIENDCKSADELTSALTKKAEQSRQQHLFVSLLVSNSGETPLPVQPLGILRLLVPNANKSNSQVVSIRLGATAESAATTVVEKGKPQLMTLISTKPLSKIIDDNRELLGGDQWTSGALISGSRFLQLWQARMAGLEASAKIARASLDPSKATLPESPRHPISLSSDEIVYQQLEK